MQSDHTFIRYITVISIVLELIINVILLSTFHNLQGNFFPMPSTAFIQDPNTRFTLLSTEPHAVASLSSGNSQWQSWRIPQRPASQWMAGRWTVNSRALAGRWLVTSWSAIYRRSTGHCIYRPSTGQRPAIHRPFFFVNYPENTIVILSFIRIRSKTLINEKLAINHDVSRVN